MRNKFSVIYAELAGYFFGVHRLVFPDTKINPPNMSVVDVDRDSKPFVSFDIVSKQHSIMHMGQPDILSESYEMVVIVYVREGSGTEFVNQYRDFMIDNVPNMMVGDITLMEMNEFNVETFPGWYGIMFKTNVGIHDNQQNC